LTVPDVVAPPVETPIVQLPQVVPAKMVSLKSVPDGFVHPSVTEYPVSEVSDKPVGAAGGVNVVPETHVDHALIPEEAQSATS